MTENLKKDISAIVKTLKKSGKYSLSKCIEENWNKTAFAYSEELNNWKPSKPIEKELIAAFDKELKRREIKDAFKQKILNSLEKRRVLQTAPHLGATESPRMLCINWLGSLGVPADDYYVVGMFSGIPFSNRSRPGRINKKNDSVNLFPSYMQDALVYRSKIQGKLPESINKLPEQIKKFLPSARIQESYTAWALQVCQNIEGKILRKRNLVYIDINEVVSEYLIRVLKNKEHVLYKIFFDGETRKEFAKFFPDEIMFYAPVMDGKYEKMESLIMKDNSLKSKNKMISLNAPQDLIAELKNGRLCPGLVVGFLVLAFLNQFKCLGSFAQVEYLPSYQQKFAKLKALRDFEINKVPTANLTTGVFPENPELYPVDIILGKKFDPSPNILFGELLLPMKNTLLESYFTGDVRKK